MPLTLRPFVVLALAGLMLMRSTAAAQTRPAQQGQPSTQPRPSATAPRQPATSKAPNVRVQHTEPAAQATNVAPRAGTREQAAAAPAGLTPAAPFVLTPEQQHLLDEILKKWELQSDKVDSFKCEFQRWEIDPTFGPQQNNFTASEASGVIKYKAPDRGEYRVDKVTRWDPQTLGYKEDSDGVERWVCDGQAIYEFDFKKKFLKVRMLPPEMKGKAISDGPLPFIFGAKAEQLKRRYMMRDVTPRRDLGKKIWLEAWPKFQQDSANFQRATVILDEKTFLPEALQLFPPGIAATKDDVQANTAFRFMSPVVNDPLSILKRDFATPMTPAFWKRVMVEDPAAAPENPPPPEGASPQAQRPAVQGQRK
jgi:TIGR03009 family protein